MLTDKEFAALLKRGARISGEHFKVQQELTKAFRDRYGTTYSDVDCNEIIDVLDYGGGKLTVAECDDGMSRCGASPLHSED